MRTIQAFGAILRSRRRDPAVRQCLRQRKERAPAGGCGDPGEGGRRNRHHPGNGGRPVTNDKCWCCRPHPRRDHRTCPVHTPRECCGIVSSRDGDVGEVHRLTNPEPGMTRYLFDDEEFFRVYWEIENRGDESSRSITRIRPPLPIRRLPMSSSPSGRRLCTSSVRCSTRRRSSGVTGLSTATSPRSNRTRLSPSQCLTLVDRLR